MFLRQVHRVLRTPCCTLAFVPSNIHDHRQSPLILLPYYYFIGPTPSSGWVIITGGKETDSNALFYILLVSPFRGHLANSQKHSYMFLVHIDPWGRIYGNILIEKHGIIYNIEQHLITTHIRQHSHYNIGP